MKIWHWVCATLDITFRDEYSTVIFHYYGSTVANGVGWECQCVQYETKMFSLVPFGDRVSERNAIFLHFNSTTLGSCLYLRETDANTVCKRSELFPLPPPPPMILLVHTSRLSSQMLITFIPLMQNASDSTSNRYPFSMIRRRRCQPFFESITDRFLAYIRWRAQLIWSARISLASVVSILDTHSNL